MSHLVQITSLFWRESPLSPNLKMSRQNLRTYHTHMSNNQQCFFFFLMFYFWRWAITLDVFFNCCKVKTDQSDGVLLRNEMCRPPSASVESARRKMLMVVGFQSRTVCSCEFKWVGDGLLPEQSKSWLKHSNPYAPNHTAVLSARGYNQGNTSKSSLQSSSASRARL